MRCHVLDVQESLTRVNGFKLAVSRQRLDYSLTHYIVFEIKTLIPFG